MTKPHFVVLRGNNWRRLFSYPREYRMAVDLLHVPRLRHKCQIHALALTPYEIDLVLTPPSTEAVSDFVRDFASPYAVRRNQQRGGSGRLFEAGPEIVPLEVDAVGERIAFTELAPVRAGISSTIEWPWTTYWLHAHQPQRCEIPTWLWRPCDWYRELGPERYVSFFAGQKAVPEVRRDVWVRRPNGQRAT